MVAVPAPSLTVVLATEKRSRPGLAVGVGVGVGVAVGSGVGVAVGVAVGVGVGCGEAPDSKQPISKAVPAGRAAFSMSVAGALAPPKAATPALSAGELAARWKLVPGATKRAAAVAFFSCAVAPAPE